MKIIVTLFFSCVVSCGFTQIVGADFYSYQMNNMFTINPAYTNYGKGISIVVGGLTQSKGVDYNRKSINFNMYSRLSDNQGLGGGVISDWRGAFGITKGWLSYAYTAKFNELSRLHFGINAGILNRSFDPSKIAGFSFLDQSDPTLQSNYINSTQFVTGFGVLFQWRELDVSVSVPHLIVTNRNLLSYLSAYTQYTFNKNKEFEYTPSFSYQRIPNLGSVFTGFFKTEYNDLVWLKVGYQSTNNIYTMVGLKVNNFRIGYSYRINTGPYRNIAKGTHGLTIGIKIKTKNSKMYNPTLHEIDLRLTKLLNKNITPKNKSSIIQEVSDIKELMKNTEINESTEEAANEAHKYLMKIKTKISKLQQRLNEN